MKRKAAWAYLEGFGTDKSILELDDLTVPEIMEALEQEREDPLIRPWKRRYDAAIRAACGH